MVRSKRVVALIVTSLVLLMSFSLSACGSRDSSKLYVGMEVGYPPMEMVGEDGKTVVGFDVDVAKELAKRMGKKDIEIVPTAWDPIFDALEANKFDCIISSVSITPERQTKHSLTNPYVANKQVLVIKKDNTTIKSPKDVKAKRIGLQQGTTAEDYMKNELKDVQYTSYQKVTQPFMDLKIGRLDAVLVDVVVAGYYLTDASNGYVVAWESPTAEPMAITFSKKNSAMRDLANKALDEMQADGTMAKISIKWFTKDITKMSDSK